MDQKSAISQRRTEKPKNPLQLHETFKINNSDFPSLDDISVKTRNQNKSSPGFNKTSFSYSDKLKAPPQERTSNFFKFQKEVNDLNKNECTLNHPQLSLPKNILSQNKHNTKNQFQSNSETSKEKQVQKSFGSNNFVSNNQTGLATGRTQLPNKCTQQKNAETNSSAHVAQEGSSDAEGWILYHKHSSTKHMCTKYKDRNNPERGFTADYKDVKQGSESPYPKNEKKIHSTRENQSSRHVRSKAYETTSAPDGRFRLDIRREVPYNNNARLGNARDRPKNSEVYSASSSSMYPRVVRETSYKEPKSDGSNRMKTYDNRISTNYSLESFKVNNLSPKSKLPNPEVYCVSSSTKQNEMQHREQQIHDRNRIPNKNLSKKNYPSTSQSQIHPNSDDQASSHPYKGQCSEQVFSDSTVTKTKKKRKSKVKRVAALQTGKIHILTPATHSKILNQANSASIMSQSNAVTNINDDEEYPELGLGLIPKNNKEIPMKTGGVDLQAELSFSSNDKGLQIENDKASTNQSLITDNIEGSGSNVNVEKVASTEAAIANVPVHSSNQITISLFDMLLTKKPKKKDIEDKVFEEDESVEHSPVKIRTKKVCSQPVNPLASSKPTVKRGKEREQPKAKKPSKMRKLILMGRKIKKESIAPKDTDIHINDQSNADTDVLSDSSTPSPTKSPIYDGEADLHDSHKNSSPTMNIDVAEDMLPVPICSCTSLPCFHNDVTDKLDPQMKEINEYKTCVSNVENEIYSNSFDKQKAEFVENSVSLELHNLRENVEIDVMQGNHLFENSQEVQTIENKDEICVKSMLDAYFATLMQSIFDDCKAETRSSQSKVSDKNKVETVNNRGDISSDISRFKIPNNLKNKIDTKCNNLAQSILDDCLSEVKILQNENVSSLDLSEKSTPGVSSLPDHNLSLVEDIDLLSESVQSNIEEFSENNCCDTNDTNSTNTSEKSGKVIDTKAVPSRTLNCSSVISSECELTMSDIKLQPLTLRLEKSSVQLNTDLPQSKFSDQEKMEAAKILLHTRRFRDYCSHFVTKNLDATVFMLLDDLARFQDRMHQKDPVKARVKRRLMYGIKEIKKHLTLKKLKGIIIATDIEDNKTEGGLNDLLKELISLSEAYHIPYVFSHKRFNLGKVCRKPAPVSCVGILNYEGSERNFKKMLELQEVCQADYTVITKKIVQMLTDDHITSLFETVLKSITTYEISKLIMKELFGNCLLGEENKNSEFTVKPEIASMKLETKVLTPVLKPEFSILNRNCELIEDNFEISKIHSILKKYNVIKT